MAPRKNAKGGGGNSSSSGSGSGSGSGSPSTGSSGSSSSPGARREAKHGGHKNGRRGGISGGSFFTWFMVIALLGVWTSVAVVWFDLVDYEEVLGKLGVYDADGDGDFDVDDAKVLLVKKKKPDAPTDLVKLSLKRRSERQQFLGHMRGSLLTLQRLVQLFPSDTTLKNDLGVGYLLLGDNDSAKKVYEEVLNVTPNDGFAKVHYGFILKAQNKISESIPYLKMF